SSATGQLIRLPIQWKQEFWKETYGYSFLVPIEADGQDLNLLVDTGASDIFFISKEWLGESKGLGACEASVYGCYECTTDLCKARVTDITFDDESCASIVPLIGNLTI
ncbi:hypothetical protein FOZ63_008809, partial [Perkinsus olseni]